MKRVFFITAVAFTTLFASCKETKKEEAPTLQENVNSDNNAEIMSTQDSIQMAREMSMDSLEQVKSHGHAH